MGNIPTTKACNVRTEYIMKRKRIGSIVAPFLFLALASTALAGLPDPGMQVDAKTALVITDPQNDFLSPKGVTWGVVGKSVTDNNTVPNIETLLKTAKAHNMPVFVSPHYYYPQGLQQLRRRLARPLQEIHQRRQDRGDEPAQGLRPGEQRLGLAAA